MAVVDGPAVRLAYAACFTCSVPLLWGFYQFLRTIVPPGTFGINSEIEILIQIASYPPRIYGNMIFMFIASQVLRQLFVKQYWKCK
jgi:hypothetical protein